MATERRSYDSPVRREQSAQTRERILAAGSEIVHGLPTWDWRGLTFKAVAERAGISTRTAFRHFATDRELRDAIMRRLEEDAGLSYDGLSLDDLPEVTARGFLSLSSYAIASWTEPAPDDPTLRAEDQRRRDSLIAAVAPWTDGWSEAERLQAAAMLDVLWSVPAYERLVDAWQLEPKQAADAFGWAIQLITQAIRSGHRPRS